MNIKQSGGKSVIYLEGEINAQSGLAVKTKVLELFSGNTSIILSFKGVVYMNSSGLREIIDLFKNGQKNKKDISLCDMSPDIREMFSFTGLDKVFKIFDTEAKALG